MGSLPPPRILLAIVVTVIAVGALVAGAVLGGGDGDAEVGGDRTPETSTTVAEAETTASTEVVDTSVVVAPDWYPKGFSRYSDREPPVTITTLAPTTTRATADAGDGG